MQWHNLVFQLTIIAHLIPTRTYFYEEYKKETFVETAKLLVDFLECPIVEGTGT